MDEDPAVGVQMVATLESVSEIELIGGQADSTEAESHVAHSQRPRVVDRSDRSDADLSECRDAAVIRSDAISEQKRAADSGEVRRNLRLGGVVQEDAGLPGELQGPAVVVPGIAASQLNSVEVVVGLDVVAARSFLEVGPRECEPFLERDESNTGQKIECRIAEAAGLHAVQLNVVQ